MLLLHVPPLICLIGHAKGFDCGADGFHVLPSCRSAPLICPTCPIGDAKGFYCDADCFHFVRTRGRTTLPPIGFVLYAKGFAWCADDFQFTQNGLCCMQKASYGVQMTSNVVKMVVFLYWVLRISTSFSDLEISELFGLSFDE